MYDMLYVCPSIRVSLAMPLDIMYGHVIRLSLTLCYCMPTAIDKALTYMNTQELPWDMDMPHKKQQQKKVLGNLYHP